MNLTVMFITHSVEEAVLLGDRVIAMSARPGRVMADVAITLPRPRDPTSPEFNLLRRTVEVLLEQASAGFCQQPQVLA
jgi:ABC-type nitrate/sulfonate/bicarbonate transport system ATPase subunit